MLAKPRPLDHIADVDDGIAAKAAGFDALYGHLSPIEIIERSANDLFHDEIAAVSSFGADSAVLLHMIAKIDRTLPVIFLDTGKHFEETLGYRDALVADFGLTNIRVIKPDEAALERITRPAICTRTTPMPAATCARSSRWHVASHPSAPGSRAANASRPRHGPHFRCSRR